MFIHDNKNAKWAVFKYNLKIVTLTKTRTFNLIDRHPRRENAVITQLSDGIWLQPEPVFINLDLFQQYE